MKKESSLLDSFIS